jgi:hypothetical protein
MVPSSAHLKGIVGPIAIQDQNMLEQNMSLFFMVSSKFKQATLRSYEMFHIFLKNLKYSFAAYLVNFPQSLGPNDNNIVQ